MKLSVSNSRDASGGKQLKAARVLDVHVQRLSYSLLAFIRSASDTD